MIHLASTGNPRDLPDFTTSVYCIVIIWVVIATGTKISRRKFGKITVDRAYHRFLGHLGTWRAGVMNLVYNMTLYLLKSTILTNLSTLSQHFYN